MLTKTPISQVAKVGAGQGAPKHETDFSESGFPFIRAGHLEDLINGLPENMLPKVDEVTAKKYRLKLYKKGTIVFAKSGMSATKGRIYALKGKCYIVNHLATLELNESAYSPYVQFALREYSPTKLVKDKAYPSISKSEIETFEIPLPKTTSDQIRIAEVLSKVDQLITQRKESINLLDELLKSTFLEMFGDIRAKKSFHKWEILRPYLKAKSGKSAKIVKSENQTEIPIYGGNGINGWAKEALFIDPIVIVGRVGQHCGVVHISKGPCWVTDNAIVIEIKNLKKLHPIYLGYALSYSPILDKVKQLDLPFINQSMILDIALPFPDINLQIKFEEITKLITGLKDTCYKSLYDLENLYGTLSQRAFKGELNLNKLDIDHIIPLSQGGTDVEENLRAIPLEENRKFSNKAKIARVGNAIMENFYEEDIAGSLKEHFGSFDFRFSEVIEFFENEKAVALSYLTSEELKRHSNQLEQDIKTFIFSCVEGKNSYLKLEQKFINAFEDSELRSFNPRAGRDSILSALNSSSVTLELEDISGIYFRIMK